MIVFLSMLTFLCLLVNAEDYCVNAVVSDIIPSSVGLNEEFTIGIQVENCGSLSPKNVTLEIITLPPDIEVSEAKIIEIPKLDYANSERFITYHMRTVSDAKPGSHLLQLRLHYEYITKDYDIEITVIGDEANLNIASVKTQPTLPYKGNLVELTLRIENTGDGTAKSVEVYVDHPFQGLKQSFIGALDSNEDGPAVLTFIVHKSGEFQLPVTISYQDDFGDKEINTNITFNVLKKKSNIGTVILVIIILSIFGAGVYYFIKTKRKKDSVIQQLLERKNHNDKSLNNHKNFNGQNHKKPKLLKKDKNLGKQNHDDKPLKKQKKIGEND